MSAPQPVVQLSHPRLARARGLLEAKGFRVIGPEAPSPADRPLVGAVLCLGDDLSLSPLIESLPNLGLVAAVAVGYDGVDLDLCRSRGIAVTHAQGLNADDVADVAMGLLLGGWRDLGQGDRMVRDGRWMAGQWVSLRPGLKGRKLGIVGLGAIGRAVARRAESFGLSVAWWGPRPKPDAPWPRAASLLDLAADSDILAVCSRAEPDNRGMISRTVIEAVGPGGMLVNVARGSLVDEGALVEALKTGALGRAGLDVFALEPTPPERWAAIPNAFLTPHLGGAGADSTALLVGQALENLRRHFAGEPLLSPVPA